MRFGTYYFLQAPPSVAHPDVIRLEIEQMAWTEGGGCGGARRRAPRPHRAPLHRLRSLGLTAGARARRRDADAARAHRAGGGYPAVSRSDPASRRTRPAATPGVWTARRRG